MPLHTRVLVLSAIASSLAACGTTTPPTRVDPAAPEAGIPAAIAAPSANTVYLTLKASGFQNYECRAKAGGYEWAFVSPEAVLRDKGDAIVGRHYGGPTWESGDGSKVTGKMIATSAAPAVGDIPWLLLQGTPVGPKGALSATTYVQRVNTKDGVAPTEPCTAAQAGTKRQVRYTADYLFYRS